MKTNYAKSSQVLLLSDETKETRKLTFITLNYKISLPYSVLSWVHRHGQKVFPTEGQKKKAKKIMFWYADRLHNLT